MNARKRRSDDAVAEILLDQLAVLRANVDGSIAATDPEALHDLRVSVRRTRTILKGMDGVFTPADHAHFKAEFKELQSITGPVRDHDVMIEELESYSLERPELAAETAALQKEVARTRRMALNRLRRRLHSQRFNKLLDSWQATLEGLPIADETDRPDASTPIHKLAAKRIDADRKRFTELGSAALKSEDPAAIHHARKRGKALRYNLEFFGGLGDKKHAKRLRHRTKKLQDELGEYQDTIVLEAALRSASESAGSVAAATAAGALIERALDERDFRLEEFHRRFKRFPKD